MRRRIHDISGGVDFTAGKLEMAKVIFYSVLGWFSITVEAFLRRDFGERYYTPANFIIGYLALTTLLFFLWILNAFGIGSSGDLTADHYGRSFIVSGYLLLSAFHFWRIWANAQIGLPQHSLHDGRSHLEPLARFLKKRLNPILAVISTSIARFTFGNKNFTRFRKSLDVSPIITSDEKFAKLWVEPAVLFLLLQFDSIVPKIWLFIALLSHVIYTRMRYSITRDEELDILDGLYEAAFSKRDLNAQKRFKVRMAQTADTLKERIQKEPKYAQEVKEENPDLMEALEELDVDLGFNTPKEPAASQLEATT
ncbi:MAG: hypothetical protein AAF731_06105 [Bacteroidota bacterium]